MTSSRSMTSLDSGAVTAKTPAMPALEDLSLPSELFLDAFPFHILLDEELVIRHVGSGLGSVLPDLVGMPAARAFALTRPCVEFTRLSVSIDDDAIRLNYFF